MTIYPRYLITSSHDQTAGFQWRYGGGRDTYIGHVERYGDWDNDCAGPLFIPSYLSGSDYSGSLVERSNHRAWLETETFQPGEGIWWADVYGGHGTFAIVIDCGAIPEDVEGDVREFFSGLANYPLADENLHSEMEIEAQGEAWESWARDEFVKGLEEKFECDLDDADGGKLSELFYETSDRIGEYWENEQGESMYIDVEKIVDAIDALDVADLRPGIVTGVQS